MANIHAWGACDSGFESQCPDQTMKLVIKTKGLGDFINITERVQGLINSAKIQDGAVLVFVKGTTAAIIISEDETGIFQDLHYILEKIAPEKANYKHHLRGIDNNGAAHIKSVLLKPEVLVPLEKGELCLGSWQQIILIDFDERPREREILVKIIKTD